MFTYEVLVEATILTAEAFEAYMLGKHLPEILATGCFVDITFERASSTRFRTRYRAAKREDLDRYLLEHSPVFRQDFLEHFPEGLKAQRELWEAVQTFQ